MVIVLLGLLSFHIYCLELVCQQESAKCQSFLVVFKFCDTSIMFDTLNDLGEYTLATVLVYMELFTFVYLIVATIGMKWWMIRLNNKKIVKEEKVFSNFSLMIKNIPKFYQLDDVRK